MQIHFSKTTYIFGILLFFIFLKKSDAQTFKFFQPQEKRDSLLPVFEKNLTRSYQIKSIKQYYENGEKTSKSVDKFAIGLEVKDITEKQVKIAFVIAKNQLFKRTFNDLINTDSIDNQPIELIFNIQKNTKLLSIENYKSLANLLIETLEKASQKDAKYKSETAFYNQVEKLKFDLKNGDEKLMQSTFLDVTFFFSAYNFPISFDKQIPFFRSDYEYFAASRACIFEHKKINKKHYFNVKYDNKNDIKQKSAKDVSIKGFDYRYSVLFDEQNFPKSVGLFWLQKTENQGVVETWTLSGL